MTRDPRVVAPPIATRGQTWRSSRAMLGSAIGSRDRCPQVVVEAEPEWLFGSPTSSTLGERLTKLSHGYVDKSVDKRRGALSGAGCRAMPATLAGARMEARHRRQSGQLLDKMTTPCARQRAGWNSPRAIVGSSLCASRHGVLDRCVPPAPLRPAIASWSAECDAFSIALAQ